MHHPMFMISQKMLIFQEGKAYLTVKFTQYHDGIFRTMYEYSNAS